MEGSGTGVEMSSSEKLIANPSGPPKTVGSVLVWFLSRYVSLITSTPVSNPTGTEKLSSLMVRSSPKPNGPMVPTLVLLTDTSRI